MKGSPYGVRARPSLNAPPPPPDPAWRPACEALRRENYHRTSKCSITCASR